MPMVLPDYPAPPGNKNESVIDWTGPASYTQVTVATPPTGGDAITPAAFGLQRFERIEGGPSDNGQYIAIPIMSPYNPGQTTPTATLLWITAATGAQVAGAVDLSARKVRLWARGN